MDYVELHCHSNFSLLDGASHPEDLVRCAAELGMDALALTDHDAVYGAVRFVQTAQTYGIRPILGAEMTLAGGHHLTLLVEDETGWSNLCWLISRARHNAAKGQAALPPADLAGHTEGLIALSGCSHGEIPAACSRGDGETALAAARGYRDLFGPDCFWIELQHHLLPEDDARVDALAALARSLEIGCVVTNDVHYAVREASRLQDVLVCIRHQTTLEDAGPLLRPNSEFYLKDRCQLFPLFVDYPEALTNTRRIAERCRFELRYGLQDLPVFPTLPGLDAAGYLRRVCEEAMPARYPEPPQRARAQLAHELEIVERTGLANYFLIVWDIVRFARSQTIRCQGRGSAANSLVAYLLGISPIDPLAHDLVFERFLSTERALPPDIDLDFQADRREEVIQYVYRRYGTDHAAMACTLVTFRERSAVRDVAKVLGLVGPPPPAPSPEAEHSVRRGDPPWSPSASGEGEPSPQKTPPLPAASVRRQERGAEGEDSALLFDLSRQLDGFPRHLGIHNGGMIIMGSPLAGRVPTEPATMPGRVVVQWDKDVLETVGLVKIDLLGLRMLSAIAETLDIVEHTTGRRPGLEWLTFDDPTVYTLVSEADTIGVFQVESRAQAQILPRLQPRTFADLIVSISLIRPGPIQGEMVHPYLRRRRGDEQVTYPHPSLEPALAETLGVILFQEQVLKVARDLAGFTPGQGEQLRRSLGSKRGAEVVESFRAAFLSGSLARGVPEAMATAAFDQLKAFAGYSFPKSHAAAFAILVYQSAWLKRYYPAAFYAALLNNQPMGFWSPAVLAGDARRHKVHTLPVDIHRSQARCGVEGGAIRLGLNYVDGLGELGIGRVLAAREAGPFAGLVDFCRRTRLPRRIVEDLVLVGAMDVWIEPEDRRPRASGMHPILTYTELSGRSSRRRLLWELGKLRYHEEELDLVFPEDDVDLPPLSRAEALAVEYGVLGLSTGDHILGLYRSWLAARGILGSRDLESCRDGEQVMVAGLKVVHQAPPTAKGHHFITLEDEDGLINVVVRPDVYTRYRNVLHSASMLIVEGIVQRRDGVTNLVALQPTAWHPGNLPA